MEEPKFARSSVDTVLPAFAVTCFVLLCAREKSRGLGVFLGLVWFGFGFLCQVSLGILQDWYGEMIQVFVFSALV